MRAAGDIASADSKFHRGCRFGDVPIVAWVGQAPIPIGERSDRTGVATSPLM
jgi:hypothetical protein